MSFFASFAKSLFNLNWLRGQKKQSGDQAWGYFFLLVFFITGLTIIPALVGLPTAIKEGRSLLQNNIPNFTANIKNGELTVSELEQPYVIKENGGVLVVDTVSAEKPELKKYLNDQYPSGALIAKTGVEVFDNTQGRTQEFSWKDVSDSTVNKGDILSVINKITSFPLVYILSLLLFVVLFVGITIGKLFLILIGAAVVYFLATLNRSGWNFKEVFTTGLYAVTLPACLVMISGVFGFSSAGLQFLVLLFWLGLVVLGNKK